MADGRPVGLAGVSAASQLSSAQANLDGHYLVCLRSSWWRNVVVGWFGPIGEPLSV